MNQMKNQKMIRSRIDNKYNKMKMKILKTLIRLKKSIIIQQIRISEKDMKFKKPNKVIQKMIENN